MPSSRDGGGRAALPKNVIDNWGVWNKRYKQERARGPTDAYDGAWRPSLYNATRRHFWQETTGHMVGSVIESVSCHDGT